VLGFIYADGYLSKDYIGIEIIKKDGDILYPILQSTQHWHRYRRIRKHWQPQLIFRICSRKLVTQLQQLDIKTNPLTIINNISHSLLYYWYRGYSDGDGCFYYNKKRCIRQYAISGSYDQNWKFMVMLSNQLHCKHQIRQVKTKRGHRYSQFRITNKQDITKIGNYMYQNHPQDQIGLHRKFHKFLEIKDS
jgi:hypothetical protein